GLMDFSDHGRVEVTGAERVPFLNNLLSNDIKKLEPGRGVYAALLTVQGKLVSDMVVYALEDRLILDLPSATREKALTTINRYLISEKAEIRDVSDQSVAFSLQGPQARAVLGRWTPVPEMKPLDIITTRVEEMPVTIAWISHTGEEGYT